MRLTHLGHACVLVEIADARLLLDPGDLARDFTEVSDLDAVLVTHQHPDHLDPERLPALLRRNPRARLVCEASAAETCAEIEFERHSQLDITGIADGQQVVVAGVRITGVGTTHALIHDKIPRIGNTGLLIEADGEPTLFHPGDSYESVPGVEIDVLALPLSAPWAAVRETLTFQHRIAPRWSVPIHDATLSPAGRALYLHHVATFGPATTGVQDLAHGEPWDVPHG